MSPSQVHPQKLSNFIDPSKSESAKEKKGEGSTHTTDTLHYSWSASHEAHPRHFEPRFHDPIASAEYPR